MKKILSFAVACSMCLCSTFSALAVGQAGDTTIADKDGNIFTLSQPILYTMTINDVKGKIYYDDSWFFRDSEDSQSSRMGNRTIYVVPENTVVYAPKNTFFDGMLEFLSIAKYDNSYYIRYEAGYGGDIWTSFTLNNAPSGGYFTGFPIIKANSLEDAQNSYGTNETIDEIHFYVTKEISNENPFTSLPDIKVNFTDVAKDSYYENAVKWAVSKDVTSGTSETTFSPNETCTTAQILTLLWRQNGQPEPTIENPFSDVDENDYSYKPALWAYEKGLVTGDKFNGNSPCTRIATVTYFYNLSDKTIGSYPMSPFNDVPETSKDYEIVRWAVSNGITSGTDYYKFSPNATCTRGQIVTFMYRAFLSNLD